MSDNIKYECTWNPKTDITAYELALCVPLMGSRFHEIETWSKLADGITRHFDVSKFDYGDMIAGNAAKLKKLF
jgi:hypothetical protein